MKRLTEILALAMAVCALTVPAFAGPPLALDVNREVNVRLEYKEDVTDEWATPQQALARGWGDCEEYALTKWAMAVQRGIPEERLKLAYGKVDGQAHVVLLYVEPNAEPLVLDNLLEPRPLSKRTDLAVTFTFDRHGIYIAGQTYPVEKYGKWSRWLAQSQPVLAGKVTL